MKQLLLVLMLLFAGQMAEAQQCSSGCTSTLNNNFNQNTSYMSGNSTMCVTGNTTVNNMNFNGSNNTICIKTGVTLTAGFSPQNVTINVYGTFSFNGNLNQNVTINVYSGGTFNLTGNQLNGNGAGTVNISSGGTFLMSNSGQVYLQGVTVNNYGTITGMTPSKVLFNQGTFNNYSSATFKNVENQEGNFNNNTGATLVFDQGTFQHGALHNNGTITVNCNGTASNTDCNSACVKMGNKNAGQFSNDGAFNIAGSLCVGAGVIFHNNGTTTVSGNMVVEGTAQWNQGSNGTTTVSGTTTTQTNGQFNGGSYCSSGGTSGTINATQACGSPPTTSDITASTCKNIFVNIPVSATPASGFTIAWDSLSIINGTDTVRARATTPTLTVASVGSFQMSYTGTSATVKFTPLAAYTGTTTIKYRIAARSGTTVSYSTVKNITVTVTAPPSRPTASITVP